MSVINFKIGGVPTKAVDATVDFTTDAYDFDYSHDWSTSISETGVVGSPTYTIECSNDKVKWYEYNSASTAVALADAVADDRFSFSYMRLIYSANGTSAGTVDVELSLNNDNA
jgi:hypothetical protein